MKHILLGSLVGYYGMIESKVVALFQHIFSPIFGGIFSLFLINLTNPEKVGGDWSYHQSATSVFRLCGIVS